jgi:hypothetical protein
MSLLKELKVEGFRCFQSLTVGGLTRVNLIVGANNSGKTALLEAVEIFATNAAVARLCATASRRGELLGQREPMQPKPREYIYDLRPLFHGRPESIGTSCRFAISAGTEILSVVAEAFGDGSRTLVSEWPRGSRDVELSSDVGISSSDALSYRRGREVANIVFVPAGDAAADVVRDLWSEVVGNPSERLVHDLLALVDDRVERLVVAPLPDAVGWEGVFLKLVGEPERIPISSFGDGMKKATQLALALVRARGGVLLIDELDDGLHYSALADLWRFLVVASRQLETQVFATSHSKDCLEAIASLYRQDPTVAVDISVHRLDKGEGKSADSEARAVANLVEAEMELR